MNNDDLFINGIRVRKLTPLETWRLMGFTDEDFLSAKTGTRQIANGILERFPHEGKRRMDEVERLSRMSNTQLYKQAGNSIVVDVLSAIMKELNTAMPCLFDDMVVGSFFSGIGAFEKALSTFDASAAVADGPPVENDELTQAGYINNQNSDANRVYDASTVARVLKSEAGGGGAKTGWYIVHSAVRGVIDPQGRSKKKLVLRDYCSTLRAQHHGNPPEVVYESHQNEN